MENMTRFILLLVPMCLARNSQRTKDTRNAENRALQLQNLFRPRRRKKEITLNTRIHLLLQLVSLKLLGAGN
jgi:hypothetical protein